jgi:hypothetical protein
MDFLQANDMDDVLDWVAVFLQEIKQIGPVDCFAQKFVYPSYHTGFHDLLLFPYRWHSPSLGEWVYLKFGISTVTDSKGTTYTYCHLDCHEDQP